MNPTQRDRIGASRGKLALAGVLAAVFLTVLASNFFDSTAETELLEATPPEDAVGASVASAAAPTTSTGPAAPTSPFGEFEVDADWPEASLDQLVAFDPLATPSWMGAPEPSPVDADAPAVEETVHSLEEMQQAANAIILVTEDHRVARIGSQEYRIGDMVGHFQITDITSAGIVLSEPAAER